MKRIQDGIYSLVFQAPANETGDPITCDVVYLALTLCQVLC